MVDEIDMVRFRLTDADIDASDAKPRVALKKAPSKGLAIQSDQQGMDVNALLGKHITLFLVNNVNRVTVTSCDHVCNETRFRRASSSAEYGNMACNSWKPQVSILGI